MPASTNPQLDSATALLADISAVFIDRHIFLSERVRTTFLNIALHYLTVAYMQGVNEARVRDLPVTHYPPM
jgi:hypothetical protein